MAARSCPTCRSIGPRQRVPGTGLPGDWCNDLWHTEMRPSHTAVASPTVRHSDPLVRNLAGGLARIERNYQREGSGPGSRFEGQLLEDVQAAWLVRELLARELSPQGLPLPLMPPAMTVSGQGEGMDLVCREHGVVLTTGEISLRTLSFEARRHWRGQHQ